MISDLYDKAKNYAYRLLGFRARSEKELKSKISAKGYSRKITDRVVNDLSDEGLIDDKKFAADWIRTRLEYNPRSLSAIKYELLARGIDEDIAEKQLGDIALDFDEKEIVRGLIKKRMSIVAGLDKQKAKQRLYNFLKRRGFSSEIILKTLSDI